MHGALIETEEQADALEVPQVGAGRTGECVKGIREAAQRITDRPVLAGIIGPYSLAGRLLDMTEIMILCYEEPDMVQTVLEKVTDFLVEYAKAFKEAGANGVLMAEPAAGLLSPSLIEEFSTPYVQKIRDAVEDDNFLVMYHNCGNVEPLLPQICQVNASSYSFGNAIDIEKALQVLPRRPAGYRKYRPCRNAPQRHTGYGPRRNQSAAGKMLQIPNFVIASGCDVPPQTPFENMDAFFETVEEFYKEA